ncbi:L-arabinonate dehydratase [Kibdelosporangium phytohabitans]|uniref:Dihydroxy-acid dehydratase n=1 Tax=Kibdelosporangium phytohabitans TaxID=860235 RepID=A0A0N7F3L7_9PSEU|nr:L-arabinonate dehydratase [Kibdelosporangium phytohabitans]ALG08983.1 dihydroxy-acid dehydratase [Kibdelosporangium phytohabitans]MBE1469843.1 dihydroxy-acid dehydratase [Kibdelosporangium phytohabitans]
MTGKSRQQLRSHRWYGGEGLRSFSHRARTRQLGIAAAEHTGKPVIGIVNTWSEINPCHIHLRERAEAVKRGVWQAGGYPIELPASALCGETFQKPTAMLYRNLLAMEVEELLRSYPVDGAVLMGGCDKTTPALLMGATSAGIPSIFVPAGPMLRGNWRGRTLGSGSDMWRAWDDKRAGIVTDDHLAELEEGLARSPGHCMTMGTASTMTSVAEVLGMTLPGAATIPAVDSAHTRMAAASGARIVGMVWEDLTPGTLLTAEAFADAVVTVLGLGGSTNAVIHLIAMARRAGVPLSLPDFDRAVPVLADIQPSGRFLMEDFYYAGGLRALLALLRPWLHTSRLTADGRTLGECLAGAEVHDPEVIRPLDNPLASGGGLAVLHGNLAPSGAVIKPIAADPSLMRHTGPAVVFDSYAQMQRDIDTVPVTPSSVLVLRGAGPVGGPGMPEHGMLPIPQSLLRQGVRDMVRISDARMSGTSFGTCVLHVAPESHIGGPLALVADGDPITLDVDARTLSLDVTDAELSRRRAAWVRPDSVFPRGYAALHAQHITQADQGCDFDFLSGAGSVPEPDAT